MIDIREFEPYTGLILKNTKIIAASIKPPERHNIDGPTKRLVEKLEHAATCLAALVQLAGVIEDMQTAYQMISRYPWHGTKISKYQHLELTWFLFQNLCYKLPEKTKLYYNNSAPLCASIGLPRPVWLQPELSKINKKFKREIRDRGNTVHSWNVKNPDLEMLSFATFFSETSASGEHVNLPEGFLDVKAHYSDSKWLLTDRAQEIINFSQSSFSAILESHSPTPATILDNISEIIASVDQREVQLSTKRGE